MVVTSGNFEAKFISCHSWCGKFQIPLINVDFYQLARKVWWLFASQSFNNQSSFPSSRAWGQRLKIICNNSASPKKILSWYFSFVSLVSVLICSADNLPKLIWSSPELFLVGNSVFSPIWPRVPVAIYLKQARRCIRSYLTCATFVPFLAS